MNWQHWIFASLIYLLIGQIFSLVYVTSLKAERKTIWLGLMGLFWWLYLVVDLVLTFAGGFGAYVKWVDARFEKSRNQES